MKKAFLNLLEKTIPLLEKIQHKLNEDKNMDFDYSSLSPTKDGDKSGHYTNALLWALKNRREEDIKNIALTGTYGSGKSSILKTFQHNYEGDDLRFLNISLATFKEEKKQVDENGNVIEKPKEELLRLIEISILQQIFYHENDSNIPDSRFKKIKSYGKRELGLLSFGLLFFLFAILNYSQPYLLQSIFKDSPFSENTCNTIHYLTIIIILLGSFFFIFKSIRIISALSVNKLTIQNTEIGIGEQVNKSILNHHIDEILYFFSIRPYNVVIIEDLDRFQETEIFTKLREINLLLNSSEKIKGKDIVFIYAVRDDMFTDKDRTKFFDFIIPVIPVINSSNSNQILKNKRNTYKYNISDDFIENIAFYIDDMRLLHNICNEFYLYKSCLESNLKQEKLFGILTYKNLYPNDFVDFTNGKSALNKIFNSKRNYTVLEISKIDKEIEKLKEEIKSIDNLTVKSIEHLRILYTSKVVDKISTGFKNFSINDQDISILKLTEDEYFPYLIDDELNYVYDGYYTQSQIKKLDFTFESVENEVNPNKSYNEFEEEIIDLNKGKVNSNKSKINELELQRQKIRSYSLEELLVANTEIKLDGLEEFDQSFIATLLRNGYIAEDFLDYVSLFHEGDISRADYQFILSIKNKEELGFDFKLNKIDKLIKKIKLNDFADPCALNYTLLDYILKNPKANKKKIELIFSKLKDESKISIEFIFGFFDYTENIDIFIRTLCDYWGNIWGYIENTSAFEDNYKLEVFKQILEHSNVSALQEIAEKSTIIDKISKDKAFLNISPNKEKIKSIISELEIEFNDVDFDNSPDDLVNFVYENHHYKFSPGILMKIIKRFGKFNQVAFDKSNYGTVMESQSESLIKKIEEKIDDYISNVYLKIESNIDESQEYLIKLLNNISLKEKTKIEIIKKVNTKIDDLSKIDILSIKESILENNKVRASWSNLLDAYLRNESILSNSIISFINIKENAVELSKEKMPNEKPDKGYSPFCKALMQEEDITNESFKEISKSSPWWYYNLSISKLSNEKINFLIDNFVISPTIPSFDNLKKHSNVFSTKLIEKHKAAFIKLIDTLVLDENDLKLILQSKIISNPEKNIFLNHCTHETIFSDIEILKSINEILINDNNFKVDDEIKSRILFEKELPSLNRIKLFNSNSQLITFDSLEVFLNTLGKEISDITNQNIKALLENTPTNVEFLKKLQSKGYISSYSETTKGLRVNHKRK